MPPSTDNPPVKDEQWVIKTFRPLLRSLKVQNIPASPEFRIVYLADNRGWTIQGMGRCVVIIEQRNLPENVGGMFITSHDMELDYFKLHIIVNASLCNKTSLDDRAYQKITAVHEFTHTVAALSAIARVRSKELIKRLKDIFKKKAHALYLNDIEHLARELRNSLAIGEGTKSEENANTKYFPDEHFRLGFEDFPLSYPVVFDEFLLSKDMFGEYFSKGTVNSLCEALQERNMVVFGGTITPLIEQISREKALYEDFVFSRCLKFLLADYSKFITN